VGTVPDSVRGEWSVERGVAVAKIVQEWETVAAMDYAHFIISGGRAESADELPDETGSLIETELLIEAHNGAGIAATDGIVLVCSPHFSNFFLPVRFELWDGAPAPTSKVATATM
jgi:hypothetical protein